jgi:hypothetical protein
VLEVEIRAENIVNIVIYREYIEMVLEIYGVFGTPLPNYMGFKCGE